MDKRLIDTIEKIKTLSSQNAEFDAAMRELFGKTDSASSVFSVEDVAKDVSFIRFALKITASNSINYDFVKHQRLRDQLYIDNLRMENSMLDLKVNEDTRFYNYCVNAFYQIENLLNYYYYITYPNISDLLDEIELCTQQEDAQFRFERKGDEQSVGNITAYYKLSAFCNCMSISWNDKNTLNYIRRVRNEGEHRNTIETTSKKGSDKFEAFINAKDRSKVLADVRLIASKVEGNIGCPIKDTIEYGEISSMLPSEGYFTYNGNSPQKIKNIFFQNIRTLEKGDRIKITMHGSCIINIESV